MQLFFSAGDPSGDLHVSRLIGELRARDAGFSCSGYGGPLMEQAGCEVDFRLTDLAIFGVLEVPPLLRRYWGLYQRACELIRQRRPDAVVLVDYPGFNWWMARAARRNNVPVLYYLPPQLWAWAPWRIHKLRRLVDHVLCCLPFEYEWYRSRKVSAEFVGHPFFDDVAERKLDLGFLAETNAERLRGTRWVGLLPGSRDKEVRNNFPVQCDAVRQLVRRIPDVRCQVAAFKSEQAAWCHEHLSKHAADLPVEVHVGRTSEIIEAAEACLMVSGSVSLELLARATPAAVVYRVDWLVYALGRALITCKYASLPNLMADRQIMPEYLPIRRHTASVKNMADDLANWLTDPEAYSRTVAALKSLREQVAIPGASGRAAEAILRKVAGQRPAREAA